MNLQSSEKTWQVGTLTYTRRQLINVFAWMLWGDFCLYLMDAGVGDNLVTVQLKKFGASNTLIAIVQTSLTELVVLILVPIISTWSDRYRSPLGRRIPFMLYATPPLAVFLTLLGFSPALASWLKSLAPGLLGGISAAGLTIALITVTLVGYKFFDTFPQSVYYYLYTDVIPPQLMGTFVCLFRVCSLLGVLVFSKFLLKHCEDYPGVICASAAGLYLFAFLMLCFQVKEGQYPPPERAPRGPIVARAIASVERFFRECFTHSFYWKYYLFVLCFMTGYVGFRKFLLLYAKELNIGLDAYGNVLALTSVVQIVIFLVLGPIVDKLHPMRAAMVSFVLVFFAALISFLFISRSNFAIWVIVTFCSVAIYQGATGALGPRLLPRSHYGQFCAAAALVFHLGQMILTPLLGVITDAFGNIAIFPWFFGFSAAGIVFLGLVYLDLKKFGGEAHYVPPITTGDPNDRAFEVLTAH